MLWKLHLSIIIHSSVIDYFTRKFSKVSISQMEITNSWICLSIETSLTTLYFIAIIQFHYFLFLLLRGTFNDLLKIYPVTCSLLFLLKMLISISYKLASNYHVVSWSMYINHFCIAHAKLSLLVIFCFVNVVQICVSLVICVSRKLMFLKLMNF